MSGLSHFPVAETAVPTAVAGAMQPPEAIATNYFAVAGAMTLNTPRLRRRCHELINYSAVAEGSVATEVVMHDTCYILSRRCRKQLHSFIFGLFVFAVFDGLFVFVSSSS